MLKANQDIRAVMENDDIKQWQLAYCIGVSECTVTRWLRLPLNKDHELKIKDAISEIQNKEGWFNANNSRK